jgi:hypothetical protein
MGEYKPLRIGAHLKSIIHSLEQRQMTESWLVSKKTTTQNYPMMADP